MTTKKYSKIKQLRIVIKMRLLNRNHDNILYRTALVIFILICIFIFLCVILQMRWFSSSYSITPVLVWLCQQSYIGVFFIPFILLLTCICQFVIVCSKPVTIDSVARDLTTLRTYDDITKNGYDTMTEICVNEKKLLVERRKKEIEEKIKAEQTLNEVKNQRK